MAEPRPIEMLLFDLDGTLVDSRRDLATAMNLMLGELNLPALTLGQVGAFIGDGARMLVQRGLEVGLRRPPEDIEVKQALFIFKQRYGEHLLDTTTAYPNVSEVLEHFAAVPKAVVTNKPHAFTMSILESLNLAPHFAVVVGGDSTTERKPDPQPVLSALTTCGVEAADAVMVGDSSNDILAGRAAGTVTCGVTYGLRGRAELEAAGADVIVDDLIGLTELFHPAS